MEDTNQPGVSLEDLAGMLDDEQLPAEDAIESPEEQDIQAQAEDQAEPEAADDAEDVEYEGKAYKVPKELKEALLRQADYAKKTQEVAEQRRLVEERAQFLAAQEQYNAATFDKAVELRDVQNRLAQFKQLDWQALADSDPVQATKLNLAYQQLRQQEAEKQQELQYAYAQVQQLTQQQRQQMLATAQKELLQRIPDFTSEKAAKLKDAGKAYAFTDSELDAVTDPRMVHVLHDAMQWRALQAQKPVAMKKVAAAPVAIKPTAQQPKPRTNQAAYERLKTKGRVEDLAAFL